jgi:hypothetical protein
MRLRRTLLLIALAGQWIAAEAALARRMGEIAATN